VGKLNFVTVDLLQTEMIKDTKWGNSIAHNVCGEGAGGEAHSPPPQIFLSWLDVASDTNCYKYNSYGISSLPNMTYETPLFKIKNVFGTQIVNRKVRFSLCDVRILSHANVRSLA
jgi:hypothetical protein